MLHVPQCISFSKMDLAQVDCSRLCVTTCVAFEKNVIMSSPKEINSGGFLRHKQSIRKQKKIIAPTINIATYIFPNNHISQYFLHKTGFYFVKKTEYRICICFSL